MHVCTWMYIHVCILYMCISMCAWLQLVFLRLCWLQSWNEKVEKSIRKTRMAVSAYSLVPIISCLEQEGLSSWFLCSLGNMCGQLRGWGMNPWVWIVYVLISPETQFLHALGYLYQNLKAPSPGSFSSVKRKATSPHIPSVIHHPYWSAE